MVEKGLRRSGCEAVHRFLGSVGCSLLYSVLVVQDLPYEISIAAIHILEVVCNTPLFPSRFDMWTSDLEILSVQTRESW